MYLLLLSNQNPAGRLLISKFGEKVQLKMKINERQPEPVVEIPLNMQQLQHIDSACIQEEPARQSVASLIGPNKKFTCLYRASNHGF